MTLEQWSWSANVVMGGANVLLVILGAFTVFSYRRDVRLRLGESRRFRAALQRSSIDLGTRLYLMRRLPSTDRAGTLVSTAHLRVYLASLKGRLELLHSSAFDIHEPAAAHVHAAIFYLDLADAAVGETVESDATLVQLATRVDQARAALVNAVLECPEAEKDATRGESHAEAFQHAVKRAEAGESLEFHDSSALSTK